MAVFIYSSGKPGAKGHFYSVLAFAFFVGIWLTDAADGFIARHFNQISEFGKIYDPFVDKLFQFTTALMMFIIGRIPMWVVMFIVLKEALMIAGGAYLLKTHKIVVHSRWYGKLSTVLFVIALASVFFVQSIFSDNWRLATNLIFVSPVLMSAFATVCYAVTMFKDSSKLGDSDTKEYMEIEETKV
jgi:CDP-diacylglycerol--glycerol-3-phosphate 3-phosphatidyltransferase